MDHLSSRQCMRGFTLIELVIGMLLTTLLIAGGLQLLVQGRIAWQRSQNIATLEERAAYALTALEQDIRLAGYWGQHSDSSSISLAPDITAHCSGMGVNDWAFELGVPVEADNNSYNLPCAAWSGPVPYTDTLTIRHASLVPTVPAVGRVQLFTNHLSGLVTQMTMLAETRAYDIEVHAWHVVRNSSEPGSPSLRRFALTSGGLMQSQEIIPGVENFQITLGIDRDADGMVDGFVNPDDTADNPVMAVRFWLLLRSAQPEPGHIDAGPWHSIDTNSATPLRPADRYRRVTAQRTIWLRNRSSG